METLKLLSEHAPALQNLRLLSDTNGTLGDAQEQASQTTISAIEKLIALPYESFGIFDGPQLVGAASLSRMPEISADLDSKDSFAISYLIVSPMYRRRGIARELIRTCISRARQLDAKWICLTVNIPNPALALYSSFGFGIWHKTENAYQHNGQLFDELEMSMRLDSSAVTLHTETLKPHTSIA